MKPEDLKLIVKEKYGEIASKSILQNRSSCCGGDPCCGEMDYSVFIDDYTKLDGYNADADLNLGCGLPTEYAGIKKGDSVLDLGSGAGNDCFVARTLTGEEGKVTGLDFTEEMLDKARENLGKTGFKNIEFVYGDIENMPLPDSAFDVVISNCVLNLVPDKVKAFNEIYRVFKNKGHFCISDVVLEGELPEKLKEAAVMYAGCVSGALPFEEYIQIIKNARFKNIRIVKKKQIIIPDQILLEYMSDIELDKFKNSGTGIFSITVTANKDE